MVCFHLRSFSCLSKAILEFSLYKFMLFKPRSYGSPISNRLQWSLEIVRALQRNSATLVHRIFSSRKLHNHARYLNNFLNCYVPQFYGLTACPSIHKYHWFVVARLGCAGSLLSPLVTEAIIWTKC